MSAALTHEPTPAAPAEHDHIVVLGAASWADFQRLQRMRGDKSAPRIAWLDGAVEITSPSRPHESYKSLIGCLVEVWCLERDIEFTTLGSWTLQSRKKQAGVEPDECYVLGDRPGARRPDLAIEVVWTSGGVDKLEIYRRLRVREVWFWERGALTVHVLGADGYAVSPASAVLPGLDLALLVAHLDHETTSAAIRAFRAAISR